MRQPIAVDPRRTSAADRELSQPSWCLRCLGEPHDGACLEEFAFQVAGTPQTKGSGKPFRRRDRLGHERLGVRNDNPRTKGWESDIRWILHTTWKRELLTGPVWLALTFVIPRPKSVSEKRRPYPVVVPDVDKLLRSVLDALTGFIYVDDRQVIGVEVEKRYGLAPGGVNGVVKWYPDEVSP